MQVVSREQLDRVTHINLDNKSHYIGEVRPFNSHQQLAEFLTNTTNTNFTFVKLKAGEKHQLHQHPIASMLIVTGGKATLLGKNTHAIGEGDVICIPANTDHGFECDLNSEFSGLSVQFESSGIFDDLLSAKIRFNHSQELIDHNKSRCDEFEKSTFFSLIEKGVLNNEEDKQIFYKYLKQWSNKFQDIIHARQCSTLADDFKNLFSEHMVEEIGHNKILPGQAHWDPIVDSCGDWFLMKMFQLDDIDKMVVTHLVLEMCGDVFHSKAALQADEQDSYLALHAHLDEGHAMLGTELLTDISDKKLSQLIQLSNESWSVLETMLNRIAELTINELSEKSTGYSTRKKTQSTSTPIPG